VSRQNEQKKNDNRYLCGVVDKQIVTVFSMEAILSIFKLKEIQPSTCHQIPEF